MACEQDLPMPTDGDTFDALLWAAQQPCVEHHRALRLVGICPSCVLRLQAKQALEMWLQLSVLSLQAGVDRHAWRDALFDPFRRWRMAYEARRLQHDLSAGTGGRRAWPMAREPAHGNGFIIADTDGRIVHSTLRSNRQECWQAFLGAADTPQTRAKYQSQGFLCVPADVGERLRQKEA